MSEITTEIKELQDSIEEAYSKLKIEDKHKLADELQTKMNEPDFWNDNLAAQSVSKQHSDILKQINPWQNIKKDIDELVELDSLNDPELESENKSKLDQLGSQFSNLKKDLLFRGEHDAVNAVMTIQAGAGGTDAQDWAEMLLRMYTRWADRNDIKATVLAESAGEEAGIKSATLKMDGVNAYGKLRSENGVHRLVRLSPFNSGNSRETSFAMVEVIPEIDEQDFEIDESDIKIDVYRAGGRGGQSVNTTDSAVRVTHIPTGTVVAIQNERSQQQNKDVALKILKSKLIQMAAEQHQDKLSELKGPNVEAAWGNQIRSYVLHPYTMVKDLRTIHQSSETQKILDGDINEFIDAYLEHTIDVE